MFLGALMYQNEEKLSSWLHIPNPYTFCFEIFKFFQFPLSFLFFTFQFLDPKEQN